MASSQFRTPMSLEEKSTISSVSASSSSSSSSSSSASSYTKGPICHNPTAANEMMPVYIGDDLSPMIWDYLDGDVDTQTKKTESLPMAKRQQLTFFGKNLYDLMAHRAATLILSGEEKDADQVVMILSNNPSLLDYNVKVKDPLGRSVEQNVFEIAFMAGDVDVKEGITEEKEQGLVERIAVACQVSEERIEKAKKVLLSEEAIQANESRNQRVLDAIKKFGEGIIKIQPNKEEKDEKTPYVDRLKAYRLRCKSVIDQFEEELKSVHDGIIKCGYIFDPNILKMTDEWFITNVNRFGGWWSLQSDVFDVNGYGKLQSNLSSRDAQVTKSGIGHLLNYGVVPPRRLKNVDGSSYFYNSDLGSDFCLSYFGVVRRVAGHAGVCDCAWRQGWKKYVEPKQERCKTYTTLYPEYKKYFV